MELDVHPTVMAICQVDPSLAIPAWASGAADPLVSVTRTSDELSIVIPEHAVPRSVRYEGGWQGISVRGPLEFSLTGVLAGLSAPLTDAGIPIFVVSTFDTDWLLLRADDIDRAVEVLGGAGHQVHFVEASDSHGPLSFPPRSNRGSGRVAILLEPIHNARECSADPA